MIKLLKGFSKGLIFPMKICPDAGNGIVTAKKKDTELFTYQVNRIHYIEFLT